MGTFGEVAHLVVTVDGWREWAVKGDRRAAVRFQEANCPGRSVEDDLETFEGRHAEDGARLWWLDWELIAVFGARFLVYLANIRLQWKKNVKEICDKKLYYLLVNKKKNNIAHSLK